MIKKSNRIMRLALTIIMLVSMVSLSVIPAAVIAREIIEAYPYPGNLEQDEGYFYIYNVAAKGYLGAKKTNEESEKVRFHIQNEGDLFYIKKIQISTEKGKEDVFAYQIKVVKSQVAEPGHTLKITGTDGYPGYGTQITEAADYGSWLQRWVFDKTSTKNQVYIRTYCDNDNNKGIAGKHPYMSVDQSTSDYRVKLYYYINYSSQLWKLVPADENGKVVGSIISEGSLPIVVGVAVAVVLVFSGFFIVRKKKKEA